MSDFHDGDEHAEIVRRFCPIDLGDGHAIGWTPSGDLHWLHHCTDPNFYGETGRWVVGTVDVTSGTGWTLRKRLPVDVGGSVLCRGCGDHGFINDGKWVKC